MLDCVQQTSGTANRGRLLRQRLGRMCEDPTVDFVFVRDAWRASPCFVGNNSKCGGDKLRRSGVLRVDQECIESSGRSGRGCSHGKGGKATCASGCHSVESDRLKTRSGMSETSPYPGLVGARGSGTP